MICIDDKLCDVCGTCAVVCRVNAVIIDYDRVMVDHDKCTMCLACIAVCPVRAVRNNSNEQ